MALFRKIALGHLLKQEIDCTKHVLYVGADDALHHDPAPYAISRLLYHKPGVLHLIDKQSPTLKRQLQLKKLQKRLTPQEASLLETLVSGQQTNATARGDPVAVQEKLQSALEHGARLKPPEVKIASIANSGLETGGFGALVDLGSLVWVLLGHKLLGTEPKHLSTHIQASHNYVEYLREYGRLVGPSGKVIIATQPTGPDRDVYPNAATVRMALETAGASEIREFNITPRYPKMPELRNGKPTGKRTTLRHTRQYSKALVARF